VPGGSGGLRVSAWRSMPISASTTAEVSTLDAIR